MVGLGFLAGYAAVPVRIQPLERAVAKRSEFLSRQLAVMIGISAAHVFPAPLAPLMARFAPFFVARMGGGLFFCRNGTVSVGIQACEHFERTSQEFIAGNRAVMVGVSRAHMPAVVPVMATTMFPTLKLAVAIGVDAREHGAAGLVELGARYSAVIVGISAEQMLSSPAAVSVRERRATRQRHRSYCNQNHPHRVAPSNVARIGALPAALFAA